MVWGAGTILAAMETGHLVQCVPVAAILPLSGVLKGKAMIWSSKQVKKLLWKCKSNGLGLGLEYGGSQKPGSRSCGR